ncbi:MAG: hormogonium polysaccharide secretion pseudopilin HpsC [Tolypothrix brevis GSE-NOS-MK-07-07A]|jgi:prepilin-type N-terminal cleavage/methylation domain-containing protein|nr:hormogonium polysaccharide secretion pseudopilin HpsC [Tolypothrix brevis GSE-NOS-MK-07-07A]
MRSSLKFILSLKLKCFGINNKNSGFTLIELLIGMVLAILIITPLLGFMIDILDTDRKEQAKATSEQEIQAALDFIERDLQQAVYIYDTDGLTRIANTTTPINSGIKDQIPPLKGAPNCTDGTICTPVLVFWKREYLADSVGVTSKTDPVKDDGFAYSLVAYYLITNSTERNITWSRSARIGRFQIRGKVSAENYNKGEDSSPGYNPPPLDPTIPGSTLKEKMNQWKADSAAYTARVETLLDYISTSGPAITCPTGSVGIGTNTSGFYACVEAEKVLAKIHLRGNAYFRLDKNNQIQYSNTAATYFPTASIQVQGRGFLPAK